MNNVKKLLYLIIILLTTAFSVSLFTFCAAGTAFAEGTQYVEVTGDTTQFVYTVGRRQIALFTLPSSYFAEFVEEVTGDEPYYIVKYGGLIGTIDKTASVSAPQTNATVDQEGKEPSLTLSLAADASMSALNLTTGAFFTRNLTTTENLSFSYLGELTENDVQYIFVKASDGTYGKIEQAKFSPYVLTAHKVTVDKLEAEAAAEASNVQSNNAPSTDTNTSTYSHNKTLEILLITGIAIPCVIIVLMLFKCQKNKRDTVVHSRNKNYDAAPRGYEDYDDYYPPRHTPNSESYGRNYRDRYDD